MNSRLLDDLCATVNETVDRALLESAYAEPAGAPGLAAWPQEPANLVFLDFDFVLNNEQTLRRYGTESVFDPESVSALNELLRQSGALVVVSSAWRVRRTLKQLADILATAGVLPGRVIGRTPWLGCERGIEIDAWLLGAPFPIASFVILDDMADMAMHVSRLVRTTESHGLRLTHARAALEVLRRPWERSSR